MFKTHNRGSETLLKKRRRSIVCINVSTVSPKDSQSTCESRDPRDTAQIELKG
jgi:hypothetical protein